MLFACEAFTSCKFYKAPCDAKANADTIKEKSIENIK